MGTRVVVTLGVFGDVDASVQWVRAERFGLRFATEIDPSIFNFTGRDWAAVNKEYPKGHVYDQFKPESKAWRPGVKPPKR